MICPVMRMKMTVTKRMRKKRISHSQLAKDPSNLPSNPAVTGLTRHQDGHGHVKHAETSTKKERRQTQSVGTERYPVQEDQREQEDGVRLQRLPQVAGQTSSEVVQILMKEKSVKTRRQRRSPGCQKAGGPKWQLRNR